jgi:hypothetical protein
LGNAPRLLNPQTTLLASLALAVATLRWASHSLNVTSAATLALLSAACFSAPWVALMLPMAAHFFNGLCPGRHRLMPAVDFRFAISVLIGRLLSRSRRPAAMAVATPGGAVAPAELLIQAVREPLRIPALI